MTIRSPARAERLRGADVEPLRRLLDADPVTNVYLRSELRTGVQHGDWWGVRQGEHIRAALLAGALAVPCIGGHDDAERLARSACAEHPPRTLVGPRQSVLALREALLPARQPRDVRDPQPLLVLTRDVELPDTPSPVRLANRTDIEGLTIAAAAMHREEMGDPLPLDPGAWQARMTSLVDLGWCWVWTERDTVIFKAELSAWTPEAVQIQGVYTHPGQRRRGIATAALSAMCRAVLRQVPVCSLYVNDTNTSALRLYERLGFCRAGDFATVFY